MALEGSFNATSGLCALDVLTERSLDHNQPFFFFSCFSELSCLVSEPKLFFFRILLSSCFFSATGAPASFKDCKDGLVLEAVSSLESISVDWESSLARMLGFALSVLMLRASNSDVGSKEGIGF